MLCWRAQLEILECEPECIHLDCVKKLGMAIMTYFEKRVNFDDPSTEKIKIYSFYLNEDFWNSLVREKENAFLLTKNKIFWDTLKIIKLENWPIIWSLQIEFYRLEDLTKICIFFYKKLGTILIRIHIFFWQFKCFFGSLLKNYYLHFWLY